MVWYLWLCLSVCSYRDSKRRWPWHRTRHRYRRRDVCRRVAKQSTTTTENEKFSNIYIAFTGNVWEVKAPCRESHRTPWYIRLIARHIKYGRIIATHLANAGESIVHNSKWYEYIRFDHGLCIMWLQVIS